MKRYRMTVAAGLVAAVGVTTAALAAGMYSQFPVVGGAAFCGANALAGIPGTSTVCVPGGTSTSVPAGPTAVSGAELIPADSGSSVDPRSFVLTLGSLNAFPYTYYNSGTQGVTYTTSARQGGVIFDATGTITAMTVVLPPSPIDGQRYWVQSTQTITTLTMQAASASTAMNVRALPTVLTVSTTAPYGYEFIYNGNANQWYRFR